MTIEGLGKKFQEARLARGLTLDEAARMTKIRPSRLAEIEGDDFSQFPSLAYAKGFLLIYGKFLDVDVTPYMEAFEGSEAGVTVDGYSYLQETAEPEPTRAPVVRRRPERARVRTPRPPRAEGERTSILPLVMGVILLVLGFFAMRFILNLTRLSTRTATPATVAATPAQTPPASATAAPRASATAVAAAPRASATAVAAAPSATATAVAAAPSATQAPVTVATTNAVTPPPVAQQATATAMPTATAFAAATPLKTATPRAAASEPEVRRAEPVRPEDLKAATATTTTQASGPNRLTIRPTKKTYMKVVIDDESQTPAFERWVSPTDGAIEFRGGKFGVRVLDRDAVQIKKNGQNVSDEDDDVTVE